MSNIGRVQFAPDYRSKRRDFLKLGAGAAVGVAVLGASKCNAPKVSFYIATVKNALVELQPFLPAAAALITKALRVADDFDKAYKAGSFADATAILTNLATLVGQIANDVGVVTPTIKGIIAIASIGLRTIATLLLTQANQPAVAAARSAMPAHQAEIVEQLGDAATMDKLFKTVKP